MAAITSEADNGPVKKIRQLLIVFGYILATLHLSISFLVLFAWGYPIVGMVRGGILPFASALLIAAVAVLLFVGTVGYQTRKRWARTTLFTYAAIWLGGTTVVHTIDFIRIAGVYARISGGRMTPMQCVSRGVAEFEPLIYESVFPIILIACLRMPELAGTDLDVRRGFTPVLPSDDPL